MASSDAKPKPPATIAGGKYELLKKLGEGCFGEVYLAKNTESNEEVAVKLEEFQEGTALGQLEHEAALLNILGQPVQPQGFVELYYFQREGPFHCLVMEVLGKSLEDRIQSCRGKFNLKTTLVCADGILRCTAYLHSKSIIHRDIKPENFMFGVKSRVHHLYMIDFGLSKTYFDKKHIPMKEKLNLTGTARYSSMNAHRGLEQSRRDDLEAIGHMLMYFLRGSLPWANIEAKTKQEKYRMILEKKEQVPLEELCKGHPGAFEVFLRYARHLKFAERPDYNMMMKLFQDECENIGGVEGHEFQWFTGGKETVKEEDLVPLQPWTELMQPDANISAKGGGFCFCGGSKTKD